MELAALVSALRPDLLVSSDAFEFSWRYQLPAVVMLPLAGALGLTALVSRRPPSRQAQTMPLRGTLRLTK